MEPNLRQTVRWASMSGIFYCSIENIKDNYEQAFLSSGYLYGEAPFTTGLACRKELIFRESHLKRLSIFIEYMMGDNIDFHLNRIILEIDEVLSRITEDHHYMRITLFKTLNGSLEFFIWSEPRRPDVDNISVDLIESDPDGNYPNSLKLPNYSFSFKKRGLAREKGFQDIAFFNDNKELLDLTTSSFVFIEGEKIVFNELRPGVLDSISVHQFKEWCAAQGRAIKHQIIKVSELSQYDAALAFNAFTGPRLIDKIGNTSYLKNELIITLINDYIDDVGNPWPKKKL